MTVDQAMFAPLMHVKWKVQYTKDVIPRLGGLNIANNFMSVTGDHVKGLFLAKKARVQ